MCYSRMNLVAEEPDKIDLMHFIRPRVGNARSKWSEAHPLGPPLRITDNGVATVVQPAKVMRYLGFYLDPQLRFREHVHHYATKACSATVALRMLGNSVRGLTRMISVGFTSPMSLTYGKESWRHPHWKRIKWIHKELRVAQSRAARWITGGFRTTPIGALEIAASLLPVKLAINRLTIQFSMRARTLHSVHPIIAHLPRLWHKSRLNISPPLPLRETEDCRRDYADHPYSSDCISGRQRQNRCAP